MLEGLVDGYADILSLALGIAVKTGIYAFCHCHIEGMLVKITGDALGIADVAAMHLLVEKLRSEITQKDVT